MKVLNLQCSEGHVFEGWFDSEAGFQAQLGRSEIECPLCGDTSIVKRLSAPRLNLGAPEPQQRAPQTASPQADLQTAWMEVVRNVMATTEDVGERFPEEARRIHYGETEERGIRGQATRAETEAMIEEGLDVMPLPIPKALKDTLQ